MAIGKELKKVLILDDNYGHLIYRKLLEGNSKLSFPVRGNILDPMQYYKYIIKQEPDVIIMNTWYKHNEWSIAKGVTLLEKIVSHYGKTEEEYKSFLGIHYAKKTEFKLSGFKTKIIYICDMGELNKRKFSIFKYFDNISFIPDKDISKILKSISN